MLLKCNLRDVHECCVLFFHMRCPTFDSVRYYLDFSKDIRSIMAYWNVAETGCRQSKSFIHNSDNGSDGDGDG